MPRVWDSCIEIDVGLMNDESGRRRRLERRDVVLLRVWDIDRVWRLVVCRGREG